VAQVHARRQLVAASPRKVAEMLSSLLWVSPAAQDLLKTTSQVLAGAVPSPPAKLASALKEADPAVCSGLLRDADIRSEFAAKLEKGAVKEVSEKEAVALVEALGAVLQERIDKIRALATPMASKLASKGTMPGFKDVVALLPEGQTPGEALQKDWLLWHAVGHAHSPGLLPEPEGNVVHERLAIAACSGCGPTADCVLALHILENLHAYIAWETSLPGSKPPPKKPVDLKGQSVLFPFDDATAKEVAARRVLGCVLPQEAAVSAAIEVAGGGDVKAIVGKLAEERRARAVIPMYVAPPFPKEKKEGKGGKAEGKEQKEQKAKGGKAEPKAAAAAAAAPAGPLGAFGLLHKTTATQELQWHLLSYRLRPSTTLGVAAKAAPSKGAQAASTAPKPEGFAGIWAPDGSDLPPGHTQFSWYHVENTAAKGFDSIWAPTGGDMPPGHTAYSWEKVLTGTSVATATSVSASAHAPAPAPAEKAPAAKPAAKADAAPAGKAKAAAAPEAKPKAGGAGGAPADGSPEAALCKLDIRCGRIRECGRVPDADSLYLLKVDVGEEKPRQVVSSLVKHYKEEELKDRQVVVYCNIKPGKMRNFESQAMVLAATKDKGADDEKCELLAPPPGTTEGTRMTCGELEAGSQSATQSVKHISKVWGQVQPLLQTNDKCEAMFSGTVLTMKEGTVTCGSLSGVGIY